MFSNIYRLADADEWARRNFLKAETEEEEEGDDGGIKEEEDEEGKQKTGRPGASNQHPVVFHERRRRRRKGRDQRNREETGEMKTKKQEDLFNTMPQQQQPKNNSRLLQELTDRERVRGMDRPTARQLLQDKLVFRGDTDVADIRTRKFCVASVTSEMFTSPVFSMPVTLVLRVIENGKTSGILQLELDENIESAVCIRDTVGRKKLKTIRWNALNEKDVTLVCSTLQYVTEKSMDSLILVPAKNATLFISWMRTFNQLRSVHANRASIAIPLSRILCVEDFVFAMYELNEIRWNQDLLEDVFEVVPTNPGETVRRSVRWFVDQLSKCEKEQISIEQVPQQPVYMGAPYHMPPTHHQNFPIEDPYQSPFSRNVHEYYQPEDAALKKRVNTWLESMNHV